MNQRTNFGTPEQKRRLMKALRNNLSIATCFQSAKFNIHEVNTDTLTCDDNQTTPSPDKFSIQSPLLSKRFSSTNGKNRKPVSILSQYNKPFKILLSNKTDRRSRLSIADLQPKSERSEMLSTNSSIKKKQNKPNPPPQVTAQSYLVMLKKTKKILISHKGDSKRQIASITKIMTALTVLHICKNYQIDIHSTLVTVQQEAAQIEGTSAGLRHGDQLSVLDLLYGMFLPSGNDAAIALAQHFGKFLSFVSNSQHMRIQDSKFKCRQIQQFYDNNYKADSLKLFVFKMNNLSFQYGMHSSHFENPTGLQDIHSYSTAQDVAILSSNCSENGTLRTIMQRKTYNCSVYNLRMCTQKIYYWKNTNKLLWKRRQCIGLKTGNTPWAGACLAAIFNIQNQDVIIIVLKSLNAQQRFNDAERLYSWYKREILSH